MARIMKKTEAKVQILSRWSQDSVEIFNQVCVKWDDFNTLLSRHKQAIHQQLDSLKSNSQSQIIEFTSQIEQFHIRWQKERPSDKLFKSDGKNFKQHLDQLQNIRREWNLLKQNQIRLK